MRCNRFVPVALAAALLGSCALDRRGSDGHHFGMFATRGCDHSAVCEVEIQVVRGAGNKCHIEFTQSEDLHLAMKKGDSDIVLRWALDASSAHDFEFRRDDAFKLKKNYPTDPFRSHAVLAQGSKFQLVNTNEDATTYEYGLLVHERSGPALNCPIDPFIHNVN